MGERVVTVIENHPSCPLDLLEQSMAMVSLEVVRPYYGDTLPTSDDVRGGLIVLGGYQSAISDDDCPWLPKVRALLRDCVDASIPTLGICLGAQLLALACGGSVSIDAEAGLEGGVAEIRWLPEANRDELFGRISVCCNPMRSPSMHFDVVETLPAGATLLGSSAMYPNQIFRIGHRAWGLQCHPEASFGTFRAWATDAATQESMSPSSFLRAYQDREPEIVATAQMVGRSFARIVAGSRH
ncbi:type 1 glutamine amidotransferase [Hoyosella subflava]|uniref:Glutamine amidotransferase class-I n=1 Tax=Hoyosella subflava (strain DSM 45089 / JCM 17490 / NBRC 109087 / DQS3-9A1) TaxID=443218 RepID=F6ELV0_HOYSD|nr:type 1 glutamine amidotransferase [Hoyosella subflava]AEF41548.1 Glutamine amidotransferase class-I [Hoyosella subflava DQS3-9A1]